MTENEDIPVLRNLVSPEDLEAALPPEIPPELVKRLTERLESRLRELVTRVTDSVLTEAAASIQGRIDRELPDLVAEILRSTRSD